jgi:hypothetical protein
LLSLALCLLRLATRFLGFRSIRFRLLLQLNRGFSLLLRLLRPALLCDAFFLTLAPDRQQPRIFGRLHRPARHRADRLISLLPRVVVLRPRQEILRLRQRLCGLLLRACRLRDVHCVHCLLQVRGHFLVCGLRR